jgi:glycine cleavage system protein P-like pyridoxal-binding family
MVEPTETETKESLDAFAEAIEAILAEASRTPRGEGGPLHDPGPPPRRGQGDPQAGGSPAARRLAQAASKPSRQLG